MNEIKLSPLSVALSVFAVILFFSLGLRAETATPSTPSSETKFQKNSETAVEETEEVVDGKKIRKIRSGKVKSRSGEATVGNIEDDEVEQVQRRQKALRLLAIGIGPYGSGTVGNHEMMYGFSFGKHWEVSTTGEIVAEFLSASNSSGSLVNGSLGFNYIPNTGEISPLFGGQFGVGAGTGNGTGLGGFSLQGNIGMRLFRLSEVQMEIVGTYTTVLKSPNVDAYGVQLRVLY